MEHEVGEIPASRERSSSMPPWETNATQINSYIILLININFIATSSLTFCIRSFVTGPAIIDHVSTNYTKVYFANIICSEFSILFLIAAEESLLF